MKLNPDCIRSILLTINTMSDGTTQFICEDEDAIQSLIDDSPELKKFSCEEVEFHFIHCMNSGYLVGAMKPIHGICFRGLSPSGHEFLSSISSNTALGKIKNFSKPIFSSALSSGLVELLKSFFGR